MRQYCQIMWAVIGLLSLPACQSGGKEDKIRAAQPHAAPVAPEAPPRVATASTAPVDSVRELARFTPAGYRVEAVSQGDLNRDAFPDQIVVLRSLAADSSTMGDETPRPLLLLLGSATGRYTLGPATIKWCSAPAVAA
ncbi:hypothetical protein [Hymenobacter cellulosilyticus]|uniref:Uncharacterized protein n=1 Tax=Hymenobacter cellulosilyticus TaxID=2932248 RepID=A0A8T9Q350_9BACT|nr:hypothetical protein [Hymenobacter cellulosilyticus]UOQ71964.1 hypothetical protein MUN79_25775 [Hymenobacter cellulosilyticus]